MVRFITAACVLLLLPVLALGQQLELPKEIKGDPGVFVVVVAKTDCRDLRWVAIDQGLSFIPPHLLKDSRTAVVMAGKPGRYRLLAYGAKGDVPTEPAICLVVISGADPDPVVPPSPPAPVVSDLGKTFQEAYSKGPDGAALIALKRLWESASSQVLDENVETVAQMLSGLRQAGDSLMGKRLEPLRRAIADHLNKTIGTENPSYSPDLRKRHSEEFAKVAKALGEVKP